MTPVEPGQLIIGHPASQPGATLYGVIVGSAELRRGLVVYVEWEGQRVGGEYMTGSRWRDTLAPSAVAVVS